MISRISLTCLSLIICLIIPIYFNEILEVFVVDLSAGWVFSTIYIRLLVIIFFAIALNFSFSIWSKTKSMKFWIVLLIAIGPGFGISFITPIYQSDYGFVQKENLPELNIDLLKSGTNENFQLAEGYQIIAFFTSGCPHCKKVSQKLGVNILAGQELPVIAFFPGLKENSDAFIEQNGGEEFSKYTIADSVFMSNAGAVYPSTYLVDKNGKTINHWTGDVINFSTLDYFLDSEF